jgi:hypothetical protein
MRVMVRPPTVSESPQPSFGDRLLDTVDADLEAVARERLPEDERQVVMASLFGVLEVPYALGFEMGYKWAREAQMFAIPSGQVSSELERIALAYRKSVRRGVPMANMLAEAVGLAPGIKFVTNAETNPYADASEAATARTKELVGGGIQLSTGEEPDPLVLENAFHGGAAFWAVETQILLHLRRMDRYEQVERWRKQERVPVIGWWLARRRKRRWLK